MGDRMKNCVVNHIVWGQGKIQSLNERYIKVLFDNPEVGEKTFVYPDAFSKYIRYEDKEYQEQVENKLQQIRSAPRLKKKSGEPQPSSAKTKKSCSP